ncbi:hypothetical protein [Streptomyces marincola]|uniref:Uncharacterized protein n=1 Tax=Streptomyces marincola TaxID=2878388 RepID=A0A1W7CWR5_9ACTN|nr:hypothetical protein [Streptomyces marincola]ARQ69176.1 hypothetical protein CAG99_10145 [Streptomyces marincola]
MTRLHPWPPLPNAVRTLLQADDSEPLNPQTDHNARPRPWDLCALPPAFEDAVWLWLDHVAQWLNWTYGWTDDHVIPACWHQHENIAHELAALAFTRIDAYSATTPAYINRWHDDLEHFHRRTTTTLGPNSPCRQGHHNQLPPRYTTTTANRAINQRPR